MNRRVRAFMVFVALMIVGAGSSFVTKVVDQRDAGNGPLPPLADGLPAATTPPGHAFTDRLQARFPIGSPEHALIMELWSEGFDHPGQDGQRRWATLNRTSFPCPRSWTVTWSVDDNDRLAAITGNDIRSCP